MALRKALMVNMIFDQDMAIEGPGEGDAPGQVLTKHISPANDESEAHRDSKEQRDPGVTMPPEAGTPSDVTAAIEKMQAEQREAMEKVRAQQTAAIEKMKAEHTAAMERMQAEQTAATEMQAEHRESTRRIESILGTLAQSMDKMQAQHEASAARAEAGIAALAGSVDELQKQQQSPKRYSTLDSPALRGVPLPANGFCATGEQQVPVEVVQRRRRVPRGSRGDALSAASTTGSLAI